MSEENTGNQTASEKSGKTSETSEQNIQNNAEIQKVVDSMIAEKNSLEQKRKKQKKQTKNKKIDIDDSMNSRLDEFRINAQSSDSGESDEIIDLARKTYLKNIKIKQHQEFLEFLRLVAPGTALRTAIDNILRARTGALLVMGDNKDVQSIVEGGFRINCKFTPQRLTELSKMDGAVILSKDLSRIVYSNTQLIPDAMIPTKETGTRHKAAERTSKQINKPVIAISQRRRMVSLYYGDIKYVLRSAHDLLGKASENIQVIEKQRELFNELLVNLNVLEFTNLVTLNDIATTIQRSEIIMKLAATIKRYIIELGVEGNLVKMQLRELIKDIEKEESLILQDYIKDPEKIKRALSMLNFENLLEPSKIAKILSESVSSDFDMSEESSIEAHLMPKGYRILNKTSLNEKNIADVLSKTKNFQTLLEIPQEQTSEILGDKKSKILHREILHLKEQVMLGKKI